MCKKFERIIKFKHTSGRANKLQEERAGDVLADEGETQTEANPCEWISYEWIPSGLASTDARRTPIKYN